MKRFFTISLIVLAFSLSINAQEHTTKRPPASAPPATKQGPPQSTAENGGWVKFDSAAGRFSVMMPEIPEDKVETTPSDHGPYTTHLFIVRDTKNVYLIGWVDYDPSFNFNRQSELEANRDNFVKGISATLTNTRTMTIDTFPVLEFTADTADRTFKSRVYMVGRRPYQIVIGYPKGEDDVAPVGRFFNSFKVNP
jgi:hypothetical protein